MCIIFTYLIAFYISEVLDFAEGGSEEHGVGKVANVNLNKRITFLDMYLSHLNKSVSYQNEVL